MHTLGTRDRAGAFEDGARLSCSRVSESYVVNSFELAPRIATTLFDSVVSLRCGKDSPGHSGKGRRTPTAKRTNVIDDLEFLKKGVFFPQHIYICEVLNLNSAIIIPLPPPNPSAYHQVRMRYTAGQRNIRCGECAVVCSPATGCRRTYSRSFQRYPPSPPSLSRPVPYKVILPSHHRF